MLWTWGIALKRIVIPQLACVLSSSDGFGKKCVNVRALAQAHVFRAIHLDDQPPSKFWTVERVKRFNAWLSSLFLQVFDLKHVPCKHFDFWIAWSFKCWLHQALNAWSVFRANFMFSWCSKFRLAKIQPFSKDHFQGTEPCSLGWSFTIYGTSMCFGGLSTWNHDFRRKLIYHANLSWLYIEICYLYFLSFSFYIRMTFWKICIMYEKEST